MSESRNGARSSLIKVLLVGLLVFPAILPAGDAPVMRAENLGDTTLFTQPLLLAVANLDQRISTTTDAAGRARLTHQRALLLERLTRTILSRGGNGFAATLPADELQHLRDTVSSARRSGDKTAEMTAILRLNSAILDQSFSDLLTTVARDWIRFAPASDFNRAFISFEHRTAFNQAPFGRTVQQLQAARSATLGDAEQALIDAYRDYNQRAEVYTAVAQSLFGFVKGAATSNWLFHWLGISALIDAIDAQPWVIDINATMLPGSDSSIGQLISTGQFFAAALLFLVLTGVGLILLPMLLRLLRHRRGQWAEHRVPESDAVSASGQWASARSCRVRSCCVQSLTQFSSTPEVTRGRNMRTIVPAVIACMLWAAWLSCAFAQEADSALPESLVTSSALESKIAEAQAATDMTEAAKIRLVELYRKALSNLQAARDNEASAATFRRTVENAPAEIQAIEAALAPDARAEPLEGLDADADTPLPALEQLLQKEQADLTAADERRADFKSRLAILEQRPEAMSQRLEEATQQRDEASAELQAPAADAASPVFAQAQKWAAETRYMALSTEIKMLDRELSSRPLRAQLLRAKRDKEDANVDWIGERVLALGELIDRKRRQAAEQATTEAEQTQRELEGMHPVVVELSAQNAALSRDVSDMTKRLKAQDLVRQHLEQLVEQIGADFQDARETLESGEVNDDLGQILLRQFETLPDPRAFVKSAKQRESEIADLNVSRLEYRAEARRIADTDAAVDRLTLEMQADASASPQTAAQIEAQKAMLLELVQQRQAQLDKALETNRLYLGKLRELDRAEQEWLTTAAEYDAYLDEQLPWLRNAKPVRLEDIRALPSQLRARLATTDLPGLPRLIGQQLARSPAVWLAAIGAVVLLWRRRAIIAAIESVAPLIGKPTTDRLGHTGLVLALTLLVAAPLPLLFAVAGWQLQGAGGATALSHAIGDSLARVALHLAILLTLRAICLPHGLAAAHFRWPERNLTLLRTYLNLLIWPLAFAVLIINVAISLDPKETGGTLAKLGLLIAYLPLSWFLFRMFHPRRGVLAHLRAAGEYPIVFRTYRIWYPLAVGYPLVMVALAFNGYVFTATADSHLFLITLWFVLALVLSNALALRWLQVTRRRLAYDAAMQRRRAEQAGAEEHEPAGEMGELQFEAPEVDIAALSAETRGLIRMLMLTAAIGGLYLIWSSALPALRIFDDVVLWHGTVTVDGAEQPLPITLGNLGLALLYAIGTWVLATRLPALLEILALQRFKMTAASRYTVSTLTTYVVVAVGLLLVLGTLGARWSQVQWLAAALSVGIGFGLQEIVANFISGLIILFERPIRVGDAVTVGDTDGVVTKIKIRATTIRNWDGKELLVPNKEFITGRLLNWSLSDQTTRLVLAIGIAYGSPVRQAMDLLEQAAHENPSVLDDPSPTVIFESFGDNALGLLLRCFVDSIDLRVSTISALNEAINDKFNAAGISIAFPQRDVHLDTIKPLRVQIEHAGPINE